MGLTPSRPTRNAFYAGKHVLITGGSSGIGKALARLLVSSGASVTLVARNKSKLAAAAEELQPAGEDHATAQRVNTAVADCSDPAAVESMVDEVERLFGPVDILVNSAGKAVGTYFEDSTYDHVRHQMESNYLTQAYPTLAVFKRMAKRRAGHIVFVSSMSGLTGVFGQASYCSAKFAVRGLAETMYYEGRPFGVNVTIVYPPDTDTPGFTEEQATMPNETREISETGGLFSADCVAKLIANGVMKKRFRVSVGFIGKLLGILTAGLTPGVSVSDVLILPFVRAITPFFVWDQNKVIRKGHAARFPDVESTSSKTDS